MREGSPPRYGEGPSFPEIDLAPPDLKDLDDDALVGRARRAPPGDERAFRALVERHAGHVRANCRYLVGSHADADDVAQEVFVRAYFSLPRFEGRASFRTWVRRIKINRCLTHLSARNDRAFVDVDDPGVAADEALAHGPVGTAGVEGEELKARIDAVLIGLPATLRIPLVLRDMDGLSYDEIAHELGIGLSAAKMRVKRGREAFRERWNPAPSGAQHGS